MLSFMQPSKGDLPGISRIYNEESAYWTGGAGCPVVLLFSMLLDMSRLHTGTYQGHHGMYCNQFWDEKSGIAPTEGSLARLFGTRE